MAQRVSWDDFGPFLVSQRRRRGLSQDRLAAVLGCHRTTIWRVEKGKERPTLLFLRGIERVGTLAERELELLSMFCQLHEPPADGFGFDDNRDGSV